MGVWKNEQVGIKGQSVPIYDRDVVKNFQVGASAPVQLELPFTEPRQKSLEEIDSETEEIFNNFRTVLNAKDIDLVHKQRTFLTLLDNHKSSDDYLSSKYRAFILEYFTNLIK